MSETTSDPQKVGSPLTQPSLSWQMTPAFPQWSGSQMSWYLWSPLLYCLFASNPSNRLVVPSWQNKVAPCTSLQLSPLVRLHDLPPEGLLEPSGTLPPSCPCIIRFLQGSQVMFTETILFHVSCSLGTSDLLYLIPGFLCRPGSIIVLPGTILVEARPALFLSQGLGVGHSFWLNAVPPALPITGSFIIVSEFKYHSPGMPFLTLVTV